MTLGDFLLNVAATFIGPTLAFLSGWGLYQLKKNQEKEEQHRIAVRRLFLALGRVADVDYNSVASGGAEDYSDQEKEATEALSECLTTYLETWNGRDLETTRRVQVMCSYATRRVGSRGFGGNPLLADIVREELVEIYEYLGTLQPTKKDREAVRTRLRHALQ